jgi:hypothetical protein
MAIDRNLRISAIKTKRIIARRNYGFEKLILKYQNDIFKATFSQKKIKTLIDSAYFSRESLDDNTIEVKIKDSLNAAFVFGHNKLMDSNGNKLSLKRPSYASPIEELVKDNLRYIKDLTQAQKDKVISILKKGFVDGLSQTKITELIVQELNIMTLERARLIASTEMGRAVAQSMEKTLKHNNIRHYVYLTAGDSRVSEICNINSYGNKEGIGNRIKHEVGNGPLPVKNSHPRCRCVICKAAE